MKRTALLGTACLLLALFSCKKDTVAPVTDLKSVSQNDLALVTANGVTYNTDTIPPTNAVDIKTLGVKGDGKTDDTKALQAAFNGTQKILLFNGGKYIINTTLTIPSGVKIYGKNGATIQPGTAMSGPLLTLGRYLFTTGTSSVVISNMTFTPSSQAFNLGVWGTSVIYIQNATNTNVTYCKFNFNQPYQHIGVEGIWVDGYLSKGTYIYKNTCNTVGIEYAESGACGTICLGNVVNNAHSQGISAQGNGTYWCSGNQVLYNTVNNAGCNGIVDYGQIDGTIIKGNTINGSGKSPTEGALGEGIQAVAVNTVITHNTIIDAQAEYIECASTNKRIDSNRIVDYNGITAGIVVNTTAAPQAHAKSTVTEIGYNNITGTHDGIEMIGTYATNVSINYNTITNPRSTAIEVINNTPSYNVTITGNTINLTKPNVQGRNAILTYATTKTTTQLVTLTNNNIVYATTAAGGAGGENALALTTNNGTLIGNKVNGNLIKSAAGKEVVAINNNGVTYTGYTFTNNTFSNCLIYATGYQTVSKSGNNF